MVWTDAAGKLEEPSFARFPAASCRAANLLAGLGAKIRRVELCVRAAESGR